MAVAKKATKKAVKKVAKKAVPKKVGAAPVITKPDLNLARRQLAHDFVQRINLRVGDEFQVNWFSDFNTDNLVGEQEDDWRAKEDEYVIFKGINGEGSLIAKDLDDDLTYELPIYAVNVDEIDRDGSNNSFKLNRDYTADLSSVRNHDYIQVGCQTIDVSTVLALAERIKAIQDGTDAKPSRELTLIADGTYAVLAF